MFFGLNVLHLEVGDCCGKLRESLISDGYVYYGGVGRCHNRVRVIVECSEVVVVLVL